MRILILFIMIAVLTGCVSEKNKVKVYRRKIEFYQPEKLKVLYSMPEEKKLPEECYKINFPDTQIAKIELDTQKLRNFNEHIKKVTKAAKEKLKIFQEFSVQKKSEISKRKKQRQLIKEMKNELKEFNTCIENIKLKRNKVQTP